MLPKGRGHLTFLALLHLHGRGGGGEGSRKQTVKTMGVIECKMF